MVHMLLIRYTIRVCHYWMYERDQGGDIPSLGLTDGDVSLLSGGL
jgi:hypothetical protein